MTLLGLTNFVESIIINSLGQFKFGRNQFDLVNPESIDLVRDMAGKLSIVIQNYDIFLREGDTLTPISRTSALERNTSIVFVNTGILIEDRRRLEQLVKDARLTRSGSQGRFPYILPSRDKIFR